MAVTLGNSSKGTVVKPAAKAEKAEKQKTEQKPKKSFFSNKTEEKDDVKTDEN